MQPGLTRGADPFCPPAGSMLLPFAHPSSLEIGTCGIKSCHPTRTAYRRKGASNVVGCIRIQ
jgi:hypothetical protein